MSGEIVVQAAGMVGGMYPRPVDALLTQDFARAVEAAFIDAIKAKQMLVLSLSCYFVDGEYQRCGINGDEDTEWKGEILPQYAHGQRGAWRLEGRHRYQLNKSTSCAGDTLQDLIDAMRQRGVYGTLVVTVRGFTGYHETSTGVQFKTVVCPVA